MAKRLNKITPIATSVALSLGLTGCFSDNDNNVKVVNPPEPIQKEVTQTANFNVTVSGKAVKGILNGALVSVQTINESGDLVDVAYRTEVGEVSVTGKATTEEEAQQKATEALLADNPAELKTNAKGLYSIVVDESFSGPLHITVKATKDSDALVKCDAFVGCGQGQDIEGNGNGKIEFGEWYKDDVELSVVKLINKPTAASSKSQPQFADGDNNQYKANVTVFTSTAAKILLKAASEKQIDSTDVSAASVKVLEALVGDTSLVAGLTGDISLGGAVDFTDVDSEDTLDASTLTLIQVAASIQVVATKAGKSVDEVLQDLNTNLEQDSLDQSETFTEVKKEAKSAGEILIAAVSGDDEALKKALVDAGVSEDEVEEAASTVKESKDKAVENSGTNEDDLKEDVEDVKDKLDNLGNDENDTANNVLIGDINEVAVILESVTESQGNLLIELQQVVSLSENIEEKVNAIAYFTAAQTLREKYLVQVVNGSQDTDSLSEILTAQSEAIAALLTRANALVALNTKYQSTLDLVNTLTATISAANTVNDSLNTDTETQFSTATSVVQQFATILEALEQTANKAIENIAQEKDKYTDVEAIYTPLSAEATNAESDITGIESADAAISKIASAIESLDALKVAATNFEQIATAGAASAAAFNAEAIAQNEKLEEAKTLVDAIANLQTEAANALQFESEQRAALEALKTSAESKKQKYIDEEAQRNAENTELLELLVESNRAIDDVANTATSLIALVDELESLRPESDEFADKDSAVAFYSKAISLRQKYQTLVIDGTDSMPSSTAVLNEQTGKLLGYETRAQALVQANDKFQDTLDIVVSAKARITSLQTSFTSVNESSTSHVAFAEAALEAFGGVLEGKKVAAKDANTAAEAQSSVYDSAFEAFTVKQQSAQSAKDAIDNLDSATSAISAIDTALEDLQGAVTAAASTFEQLALAAKVAADAYKAEADAQQTDVEDATSTVETATNLVSEASTAGEAINTAEQALTTLRAEAVELQQQYQTQKENDELNAQLKETVDTLNARTTDEFSKVISVKATLADVQAQGANANSEALVTAYFIAATALTEEFSQEVQDNLNSALTNYLSQAEATYSAAKALSDQNNKYLETTESAQKLVDAINEQLTQIPAVSAEILSELEKATEKAKEFDVLVDAAKMAAEAAVEQAEKDQVVYQEKLSAFEEAYNKAVEAFDAITNVETAQLAVIALENAEAKFAEYMDVTSNYRDSSQAALDAVQNYVTLLGGTAPAQDGELTPAELLAKAEELNELSSNALTALEQDTRDEKITGFQDKSKTIKEAREAADKSLSEAVVAQTTYSSRKTEFEDAYTQAITDYNAITSSETARVAIDSILSAMVKFEEYQQAVNSYSTIAAQALSDAQAFDATLKGADDTPSISAVADLTADELLIKVKELDAEAKLAKGQLEQDKLDEELDSLKSNAEAKRDDFVVREGHSDIAREGTEKVVTVSFVTKDGASAIYDFGEVMLNVVEDIVDKGTFDTGKQSGTSDKYPDWSYSYDLDTDNKDLWFVFENASDGQKIELTGTILSGADDSTIALTWSGNLITESGQKLVMPQDTESLSQCASFANGLYIRDEKGFYEAPISGVEDSFTGNASCLYIALNKDVAVKNPDFSDLEVQKVASFNVAEFIDGQYGFDGIVEYYIYGEDSEGNSKGLFSSGDVIEHADFKVEGITEQTEFRAIFDVKYDDIHTDIGTFDVNLLNFNGYEFKVDLVSEVGPLEGEVTLYNGVEGKERTSAGAIREITNGFKIIYIDGVTIDYTDIDFLGKSN